MQTHVSVPGRAHRADGARVIHRALPEEVPVALVFNGTTQAVMMATPSDVEDFAHGFALTEGIVTDTAQIEAFEIAEHAQGIEARFWLRVDRAEALSERRRSMAGPVGCGLCGIDSLEQALRTVPRVVADLYLSPAEISQATEGLRDCQRLHHLTRATHAAGFLVPGAGVTLAREDVGRHNALDKLIGALLLRGTGPATGAAVMTSRLSVELVQKCALAGIPVLIAVSAPTGAAMRLADSAGITLVAFARSGGFDIYTHPHRISNEAAHVA
ncbi:formate dehydrogenase accessory sulfurtransferase FdhD [Sedimentitalea sp. XS_ASV28]|uniref:formate dehydrogenase accessory sulfurtransferase FdhD n=1 Tax=Sedimentitalea sp. XS_ASV28 TaxID=3241296 RepID=UPI003517B291